eukprot:CAMPEP_0171570380 /NCGR_PEP_ID=MMETSP0961-20121227/2921_1 /TAXON_ID=87120 /ORGANISM="Aurantiochytrium limacinum, Strain ATCCMYA-1381" /LENGTH=32 /DNA_ID= /DNA_START= /DNA_END= /DNA_ORIENTATION=
MMEVFAQLVNGAQDPLRMYRDMQQQLRVSQWE